MAPSLPPRLPSNAGCGTTLLAAFSAAAIYAPYILRRDGAESPLGRVLRYGLAAAPLPRRAAAREGLRPSLR